MNLTSHTKLHLKELIKKFKYHIIDMHCPKFQKVFKQVTDISTHFWTDRITALLKLAPRQLWTICSYVLEKKGSHDTGIIDAVIHK